MYPHQNKIAPIFTISCLLIFLSIIIRFVYPTITDEGNRKRNVAILDSTNKPARPVQPPKTPYPSEILNLTNWKLTIPTSSSGIALEIKQPSLSTYNLDPWFVVTPEADAVRFRAAVNGSTTSGSDYPRSELREMTGNGKTNASWSSSDGVHTMILDQAITAVPKIKRDVVAGQIHDDRKDIVVVRLNYPILHIRVDGTSVYTLDPNYTLGKRFTVKFVVSNGLTKVYYNNSVDSVFTLNKKYSNAYFKAGAYVQSNCKKEVDPPLCNENNYGEVVVYNTIISH